MEDTCHFELKGRGFYQSRGRMRKATKTKGKNRLFFRSQHKHCNYFYEDAFEKLQSDGLLTRLDLAWSRDSAAKSYVQHKISENVDEI
ncbi:MAG TPA: hypothetical protein VM717_02320 [Chthoniobacterales bacterium]|nr:hypothetical protein [Chthoniobacterales bacterium]